MRHVTKLRPRFKPQDIDQSSLDEITQRRITQSTVRPMPTLRRISVEGSGTGSAVGVARKPCLPVPSKNTPTICPTLLISTANVEDAPGTSIGVKLPPVSRKPWLLKAPTICSALLMPKACVKDAPGTSI